MEKLVLVELERKEKQAPRMEFVVEAISTTTAQRAD
jgi:hypothetical protein